MNLALKLSDSDFDDINNQAQSIINNLIYLNNYKDCKAFVKTANDEKIFVRLLGMFESIYYKKYVKDENVGFHFFSDIIEIVSLKIIEIKNYPNKTLKKKFLRIDDFQLGLFDQLKFRYNQVLSGESDELTALLKEIKDDENVTLFRLDGSNIKNQDDKLMLLLGLIYQNYRVIDADNLTPVAKKLIRNAYAILKKYEIQLPKPKFEEQVYLSSLSYKKALTELAK